MRGKFHTEVNNSNHETQRHCHPTSISSVHPLTQLHTSGVLAKPQVCNIPSFSDKYFSFTASNLLEGDFFLHKRKFPSLRKGLLYKRSKSEAPPEPQGSPLPCWQSPGAPALAKVTPAQPGPGDVDIPLFPKQL